MKTWIKIAIPIASFVLGLGAGYLLFNNKIEPNPTITYLEEDIERLNTRYDSLVRQYEVRDSVAAFEIKRRDSIKSNIKKQTNESIRKGIDDTTYYDLIESNRARGKQRFSN